MLEGPPLNIRLWTGNSDDASMALSCNKMYLRLKLTYGILS